MIFALDPFAFAVFATDKFVEIIDIGPGGRGPVDDLTAARRAREEKEVLELAMALIMSGVLDELQ